MAQRQFVRHFESVPSGQFRGRTVCRSFISTNDFSESFLPQAMRTAFPSLFNALISMLKDTSLAATITVTEMFKVSQQIVARTYEPLLLYLEVGLIYFDLLNCSDKAAEYLVRRS